MASLNREHLSRQLQITESAQDSTINDVHISVQYSGEYVMHVKLHASQAISSLGPYLGFNN